MSEEAYEFVRWVKAYRQPRIAIVASSRAAARAWAEEHIVGLTHGVNSGGKMGELAGLWFTYYGSITVRTEAVGMEFNAAVCVDIDIPEVLRFAVRRDPAWIVQAPAHVDLPKYLRPRPSRAKAS